MSRRGKGYKKVKQKRPADWYTTYDDYGGFPESWLFVFRVALTMAMIIGFPFVLFWFSESIKGYLIITTLFLINEFFVKLWVGDSFF